MKNPNLIIVLLLGLSTGFASAQKHTLLTYRTNVVCKFNDDYSGVDTSFLLIDNGLIKDWNKYDDYMRIYNSETNEKRVYLTDHIKDKNITYKKIDTLHYEVEYQEGSKNILGYDCKKIAITSKADTLIGYFTREIGVNYSPVGAIDGFVLEYDRKNKYYKYHSSLIAVDRDTPERIEIKDSYEEVSHNKYLKEMQKIEQQQKQKALEKDIIEIPGFPITDMKGNKFDLQDKRGKIVVFNFWAIGCRGCVAEIPTLNEVTEYYKGNDKVEFYAFAMDGNSNLMKFLPRKPFEFTIVPNSRRIFFLYGIYAMPSTVIIDQSGKVAKEIKGPIMNKVRLIKEIDNVLLGE